MQISIDKLFWSLDYCYLPQSNGQRRRKRQPPAHRTSRSIALGLTAPANTGRMPAFVESKDGKVTLKKEGRHDDHGSAGKPQRRRPGIRAAERARNDSASVPAEETRPPGPSKQPAPSSQHGRSNVAEINPSGGKKSTRAALPEAKEVVVTGVGTDPDKAMQNAFSQAIEQTVGVLVDAETVVKNDQLIRDEILTYSRGYVEKYEVVKRWEEDGLHHATIRAVVARDKLVEKLRGMKIAVHEVAGDLASRQIEFDAKNEEQAAEMFKKALADFDMTKLTKVEIVGKPEITREGANAKVRIKVKLSPDREQWKEFARGVRLILDKTATKRAAVTVRCGGASQQKLILKGKHGEHEASKQLKRQLDGQGVLVGLFVNTNISGEHIQWEVFRVPDPMDGAIKVIASGLHYRLAYILSDEKGEEIVRTNEPVTSDRLLGNQCS